MPETLLGRPFTSADALLAGLTRKQLRSSVWRHMFRDVYVDASLPDTPELTVAGLRLVIPKDAVATRTTAALIHGVDVRRRLTDPLEVTIDRDARSRGRTGVKVRQALIPDEDIVEINGVLVTTGLRTTFDLARQPDRVESVVGIDGMLHANLCTPEELVAYIGEHPHWRGVRTALTALDLAEPKVESPMETRLRMVLVFGGLPRPRVQIEVRDEHGVLRARLDMGYDEEQVGVEFDGAFHLDQLEADFGRDNVAGDFGWWMRRYGARHVYQEQEQVVRQVARALEQRRRRL